MYGEEISAAVVIPEMIFKGELNAEPLLRSKETVPSVLNAPELKTVPPAKTSNSPLIIVKTNVLGFKTPPDLMLNIVTGFMVIFERIFTVSLMSITISVLVNDPPPDKFIEELNLK